jgi:predicted nucleic acid-binding protein
MGYPYSPSPGFATRSHTAVARCSDQEARTYVDSCVLIAAWQGTDEIWKDAMAVLDDPERRFVISPYLKLEVLPKPRFHKKEIEVAFMEEFLAGAAESVSPSAGIAAEAIEQASKHDLAPVDALHASIAKAAEVDELVTIEGETKPLLRVKDVKVVSLRTR